MDATRNNPLNLAASSYEEVVEAIAEHGMIPLPTPLKGTAGFLLLRCLSNEATATLELRHRENTPALKTADDAPDELSLAGLKFGDVDRDAIDDALAELGIDKDGDDLTCSEVASLLTKEPGPRGSRLRRTVNRAFALPDLHEPRSAPGEKPVDPKPTAAFVRTLAAVCVEYHQATRKA